MRGSTTRIAEDARVTKLYFESTECGVRRSPATRCSSREFFNATVDRAAYIGDSIPDGIPIDRVDVDGGRLVFESGTPLVADYVVTQPGIELDGAPGRDGNDGRARSLARRAGEVRMTGADTNADVRTTDCA